jgi:hypothetical protein
MLGIALVQLWELIPKIPLVEGEDEPVDAIEVIVYEDLRRFKIGQQVRQLFDRMMFSPWNLTILSIVKMFR